ncbi:MAG: class I SAM-dependent methyltransferase [Gammaproteobacteria bacterium]|nr:class I SAM-dependent methyltransferase [Gammaproteobacteria bacterium]
MDPQRPSRTAEGAAALRVWHTLLDDPPHVFDDSIVRSMLSGPTRLVLHSPPSMVRNAIRAREALQPELAALRGQVVLRSRFAEDALDAALAAGCEQVVILAAGLDTTAQRRPELARSGAIFEVDHPATQAWKRERLPPDLGEAVRFVAMDFEREALDTRLAEAGLRSDVPMFVNWLGCTYYLEPAAVTATFEALGRIAAPGSEIVLDHWLPEPGLNWRPRLLLAGVRFAVALQREPLRCLLTAGELAQHAAAGGWQVAEQLDAKAQRERWLAGRSDTLSLPDFAHVTRLVRA